MHAALAEIYLELTQLHGALRISAGDQGKALEAIATAAHCVAVAANSIEGEVAELEAKDLAIMGIHSVLHFIEDQNEGFEESTRLLARRLRYALFTVVNEDIQGTLEFPPSDGSAKQRH